MMLTIKPPPSSRRACKYAQSAHPVGHAKVATASVMTTLACVTGSMMMTAPTAMAVARDGPHLLLHWLGGHR